MKLFLIWCFHAITMCFVVDNRVLLVHIMFLGGKRLEIWVLEVKKNLNPNFSIIKTIFSD